MNVYVLEFVCSLGFYGVVYTTLFLVALFWFIHWRRVETYGYSNSVGLFFLGLFALSFFLGYKLEGVLVEVPSTNPMSYLPTALEVRFWSSPSFWKSVHLFSFLSFVVALVFQKKSWGRVRL
ncbi:hypothetical protein [Maridesulfovibrio sp.]|uniref:hypothetical protein n=1 Tax=Maridesulfovibrio sp. TaxID=2795000 RepID=UPI0039EF7A39